MDWRRISVVSLAMMAAGCDQFGGGEVQAPPAPAPAVAAPVADLASYAGRSYAEFVAAHQERFSADALGIGAADSARLQNAMAASSSAVLEGGGAEALVFRGCAATGCGDGVAVVAIEGATGETFVGVRDAQGKDVLAVNDRLEALLSLNTSTRDWSDAGPLQQQAELPPAEETRP